MDRYTPPSWFDLRNPATSPKEGDMAAGAFPESDTVSRLDLLTRAEQWMHPNDFSHFVMDSNNKLRKANQLGDVSYWKGSPQDTTSNPLLGLLSYFGMRK